MLLLASCHSSKELKTVAEVDLDKYGGTWYDIAHLPQKFQEGCKCVTANYTKKDGYVEVINTCIKNGKLKDIKGKAFPVKGTGNSKLKVQFFWPFKGDYQIIALDENYQYALVGSADRESLWILSRDPQPSALVIKDYLNKAEELGFNTSQMVYTDQSCHATSDEQ